ncbi:hypothetical protein KKA47_06870 [bacterium]|nr:hypothetical protein [bacterium]
MQNQKIISANFKTLLKHLFKFQPVKECSDEIWQFYALAPKCKRKWLYQSFVKYQDTVYWTINSDIQFEFNLKKETLKEGQYHSFSFRSEEYIDDIPALIKSCVSVLKEAEKDWLGYHNKLLRNLPKNYRFGLIERKILWEILPDIYRPDLELTPKEYDLLMEIFDQQERSLDKLSISSPTLQTYLNYCKVAYLANFKKCKSHINKQMSGLEMYKAMADGRHEGLIDISPDCSKDLVKWYNSGRGGGHPWEICRGGNSTHIDLGILHEYNKWFIFLNGNSTGRMLETARMALIFYKKKMPFRWFDFKDVQLKMEGRDNIGTIPERFSLHRANQLFNREDKVFDCLHYSDLNTAKKQAKLFITFLPLEPLYPNGNRRK